MSGQDYKEDRKRISNKPQQKLGNVISILPKRRRRKKNTKKKQTPTH